MNFILLYFDKINIISYFYRFDDGNVYVFDKKDDTKQASYKYIMAIIALMSPFIYSFFRNFDYLIELRGINYILATTIISYAIGFALAFFIKIASKKYLVDKYKVEMPKSEIRNLFELNKRYIIKFYILTIILLTVGAITTFVCSNFPNQIPIFISNIIILSVSFFMIFLNNPVNYIRLINALKNTSN